MGKAYIIGAIHHITNNDDGGATFLIDQIPDSNGVTCVTRCFVDRGRWDVVKGDLDENENCCVAGEFNSDKDLNVSKIAVLKMDEA